MRCAPTYHTFEDIIRYVRCLHLESERGEIYETESSRLSRLISVEALKNRLLKWDNMSRPVSAFIWNRSLLSREGRGELEQMEESLFQILLTLPLVKQLPTLPTP